MAENYTICPAQEAEDLPIRRLVRECGINPFGIHWPRFLIALDESGALVGCGQVRLRRDRSRELASLAVAREWRRRGVASAIIYELKELYGAPIWLTCMEGLVPFYEKSSFVEVTNHDSMPPYFRRAQRYFNLYLRITGRAGRLAVMAWFEENR